MSADVCLYVRLTDVCLFINDRTGLLFSFQAATCVCTRRRTMHVSLLRILSP